MLIELSLVQFAQFTSMISEQNCILNGRRRVACGMEIFRIFITEETIILEQILELIILLYKYTFQALEKL